MEPHVNHEGVDVMLSFGQFTEGANDVMFYMLQQLNTKVYGGRRRSKGKSGVATLCAP